MPQPPAPVPPPPAAVWKLPIAFTAQGFRDLFSAEQLAARLEQYGVGSVAIQIGEPYEADPSAHAAFHRRGIAVYLWGLPESVSPARMKGVLAAFHADGWIPQVEDDPQYFGLLAHLEAGVGEGLPRAIVTNFEDVNKTREGLPTPGRMERLLAAGIRTAFVECYLQTGDPNHRLLPVMLGAARAYGWETAIPVIGLFPWRNGDVRVRDYDLTGFERAWGFYYVEGVAPDDWPAIAAVGAD